MTDLRKAAEDILETLDKPFTASKTIFQSQEALRQALAQPEQEPVAWMCEGDKWGVWNPIVFLGNDLSTHKDCSGYRNWQPLYTAPPKREWVGLTKEDKFEFAKKQYGWEELCDAADAKLKEKNT